MASVHIARHPIDPARAKDRFDLRVEVLGYAKGHVAKGSTGAVNTLEGHAAGAIAVAMAVDPAWRDLETTLKLGARAAGALWALAHADGQPLEMAVVSDEPQRFTGRVDGSVLSSASWLDSFWLAVLAGDDLSLAAICHAPPSIRRDSITRVDDYVHLFADALRLWWLRDERAASVLLEALRATDPARGLIDAEWALDLDVPQIEVAARVLARDTAALDQSLAKAFELHRKYWSAGDRAGKPDGWVSFGLAALMVLADGEGVRPTVTSDYAPQQLVGAHERIGQALILCPYCLVPITRGVTVCHACLEDPRNDAAIESDIAELRAMARKRCPACSTLVPRIAVRCASCRTRF